jgi:hypothetical protein
MQFIELVSLRRDAPDPLAWIRVTAKRPTRYRVVVLTSSNRGKRHSGVFPTDSGGLRLGGPWFAPGSVSSASFVTGGPVPGVSKAASITSWQLD